MAERRVSSEKCTYCPNRGRIAKLLARVTRQNEVAGDCEGSVKVSRGQIVTQVRTGNEPSPPQKTWSSMTSSVHYCGERRYSRTDWTTKTVCGREPIKPHDGEAPYGLHGEFVRTNKDGQRIASFIKGDENELSDHYGMLGIMELLDAATEMEDAEDSGNTETADKALEKIKQYGFDKPISAGRRGTGKSE